MRPGTFLAENQDSRDRGDIARGGMDTDRGLNRLAQGPLWQLVCPTGGEPAATGEEYRHTGRPLRFERGVPLQCLLRIGLET